MEFDFDIVHSAGIFHQEADYLSRLPTEAFEETDIKDDFHNLSA